ncbi:MAG: DUF6361 family protein [Acidimicrobiales bacterium]
MSSRIAWLDASADEQRRIREIVQLFSQKESVDELGGRRIVVVLSDALFPGTSVLHTRARYLLFVPWLVKLAAHRKHPAQELDRMERRLIQSFLDDDTVPQADRMTGLIGSVAGPTVKQLPSIAYWTALEAWGILQIPGRVEATLDRTRHRPTAGEADELAERAAWVWHPGVGEAPKGFPDSTIAGGFRLQLEEANWLRERWLATTEGSLLAHLVRTDRPLSDSWAPWDEPACRDAPSGTLEVLRHAQRFSLAMAGARQLYQLLLVRRYLERGFNQVDVDLDAARNALDAWAAEVMEQPDLFDGWDPNEFWDFVLSRNARIDPLTRVFFTHWFDLMRRGELGGLADDTDLQLLVYNREHRLKAPNGRLANDALLASWQGADPGRVTFRWPQVHRFMSDLHDGLHGDASS